MLVYLGKSRTAPWTIVSLRFQAAGRTEMKMLLVLLK